MNSKTTPQRDYWEQSRKPWPSLLFLLPFLLVYEVGTLTRTDWGNASRNGADIWIRHALQQTGVSSEWLFPLLVPIILISWHLYQREPWTCFYQTLSGMFAESVLFAMLLVVLGQLMHMLLPMSLSPSQKAISFLGAGIYEELLFRLMLLPVIYLALRGLLVKHRWAMISSVLVSSLIFAAAHYIGPAGSLISPTSFFTAIQRVIGDSRLWYSFSFRCLAGLGFSVLFWTRGFGITAGCHILYDLIVGVVLGSLQA